MLQILFPKTVVPNNAFLNEEILFGEGGNVYLSVALLCSLLIILFTHHNILNDLSMYYVMLYERTVTLTCGSRPQVRRKLGSKWLSTLFPEVCFVPTLVQHLWMKIGNWATPEKSKVFQMVAWKIKTVLKTLMHAWLMRTIPLPSHELET